MFPGGFRESGVPLRVASVKGSTYRPAQRGVFMTLVAAISVSDAIVVASDRVHLVPDGQGGHCRFDITQKVVPLGKCVVGFSGDDSVLGFIDALQQRGVGNENTEIDGVRDAVLGVCGDFHRKFRVPAEGGSAALLLAGFRGSEPRIYVMSSSDHFQVAYPQEPFGFVGVVAHAVAITKKLAPWIKGLDLEQAKRLACYLVTESGRSVLEIGDDVDVAIGRPKDGFQFLLEPERLALNNRAKGIGEEMLELLRKRIFDGER